MTATSAEASSASQAVIDLEREYLLQNYARYPLVLRRGRAHMFTTSRQALSGFYRWHRVNALGHAHPRISK